MNVHDLKEQRAAKIADMRVINEKALSEKRDLNEAGRKQFDALDTETRSISDQIGRAEKLADYERFEANAEPVGGAEMGRELRTVTP
jgi:hypothetical protein